MNCDEYFEILYKVLDRDLEDGTLREVEVHLQFCKPCWDRLEFEKKLKERLMSSCRTQACSDALLKRIKSLLQKY